MNFVWVIIVDGFFVLIVMIICEVYEINFEVIFFVDFMFELGDDLVFCLNDFLLFELGILGVEYLW